MLGSAEFRIRSSWDKDDFKDALAEFKQRVPSHLRAWKPDDKLWSVRMTVDIEAALVELFDNAEELIDEAHDQLPIAF